MSAAELAQILDELGRRLGPTGEYVFALAVRQVYIDAFVTGLLFAVIVAAGVIAVPRLERWRTAPNADTANGRDLVLVAVGISYAIVLVSAGALAMAKVPAFLNPEYAALTSLLGQIR